eukprot:9960410-Lingulodinium_polyedra.AAC.1
MQAMEKLTRNLEKKHEEFTFRVNQMKYARDAREGRCPTNEYVKEYQTLLGEELRALEADELVAKKRQPKDPTDELHANLLNA